MLNHRIEGRGRHVLLLHPVGLDLTFWQPVARILSSRFTVLSVDLRGHGGSSTQPPARSLEDHADDLHALLAELAFAPVAAVGLSFGGMIAQVLALRHPDDVEALVISGCGCSFPQEARVMLADRGAIAEKGGMAAVVDSTLDRWFTAGFRASGGAEPTRARLLSDDVMGWAAAWRAISGLDTAPYLGSIRVPALCIAGEVDVAAPPTMLAGIAERIPGARLQILPGAPHMMQIERPEAFAEAVQQFLT